MANPNIAGPVRTAVQIVPAAVIIEFLDAFFFTFDPRQYAAALAALTVLLSYLQNSFEMLKGRAFLKENPAD